MMIFTLGAVLFLICSVAVSVRAQMYWYWKDWITNSLGILMIIGWLLMLYSLLALTWEYLP